jgi:hypothetical protein
MIIFCEIWGPNLCAVMIAKILDVLRVWCCGLKYTINIVWKTALINFWIWKKQKQKKPTEFQQKENDVELKQNFDINWRLDYIKNRLIN